MAFIAKNREEDLKNRNGDILVFDFDGTVTELREAVIWFNNDGNYVEPTEFRTDCCLFC